MTLAINQTIFDGKWAQLRGTLKQRWGDLTDDDLMKVQGRYEQFLGILQQKYGYSRQTAEKEVSTRLADLNTLANNMQTTAQETITAVDQTVTERRWTAVLAAWLVGIAVGMWVNHIVKS